MIITKTFLKNFKVSNTLIIRFHSEKHMDYQLFCDPDNRMVSTTYSDKREYGSYKVGMYYLSIYHYSDNHINTAINSLKAGDNIYFEVVNHTTETLFSNGMQCAGLNMHVQRHNRKGDYVKTDVYMLDISTQRIAHADYQVDNGYFERIAEKNAA